MIRRVIIATAAAAFSTGLLGVAAAAPAAAGTPVGCSGASCSVSLSQFIKLGGSYGNNSSYLIPITVAPPPCLWVPIGDQTTGSNYIIGLFPHPDQSLPYGIYASVQQAKALLKNPQPGTWYNLPINPAAGPAGVPACLALPAFYFVPPGGTPPMPYVPPVILAEYAYNHMSIPAPHVTTSPAGQGWVNLATFAWTNSPKLVWVSATLGTETVTVDAVPVRTTIATSTAGTPYSAGCGPNGSRYPPANVPPTGPDVPPDCGVLWQVPSTGATISATVTWHVTWHVNGSQVNHTLPDIPRTGTSGVIRVAEIQSINGG
jgi:hypothetical protein